MTSNAATYAEEIRDTVTSKKYLDAGLKAERTGERVKAIEAYEAAYAADPDNSEVCFRLAINLDLVGEEEEALHLYEQATQHERPHLHALLNLAIAYEDRAMYAQAERCLRQVLATEPNHPRARLYIKDVLASKEPGGEDQGTTAPAMSPLGESALLDTPVTDFELSVKTRNALRKMNMRTLADLLRISETELRSFKNLSEDNLDEIKSMLGSKGLRLGQASEQQQTAAKKAVYDQLKTQTGAADDSLNRSVNELQLSVRARKALALLGVTTVGDLCTKTEAELMGVKNFGMTSLLEIKEKLAQNNLSLRKMEE